MLGGKPPKQRSLCSSFSLEERNHSGRAHVTSGALTLSPACRRLRQQRAGLGAPGLKSCGSEDCHLRRCLRPPSSPTATGTSSGKRRGRCPRARAATPCTSPAAPLCFAAWACAGVLSGNQRLSVAGPSSRGTSNRRRRAMAVSRWVQLLTS